MSWSTKAPSAWLYCQYKASLFGVLHYGKRQPRQIPVGCTDLNCERPARERDPWSNQSAPYKNNTHAWTMGTMENILMDRFEISRSKARTLVKHGRRNLANVIPPTVVWSQELEDECVRLYHEIYDLQSTASSLQCTNVAPRPYDPPNRRLQRLSLEDSTSECTHSSRRSTTSSAMSSLTCSIASTPPSTPRVKMVPVIKPKMKTVREPSSPMDVFLRDLVGDKQTRLCVDNAQSIVSEPTDVFYDEDEDSYDDDAPRPGSLLARDTRFAPIESPKRRNQDRSPMVPARTLSMDASKMGSICLSR